MSHVVIELADEGGSVRAGVTFIDGFNRFSNAHQTANLMLKQMDSIMKRQETVTEEVATKLNLASV